MPTGSGTNSNMNGIRIESRVLAPPGGFSSVSFGSEASNEDKFKGHNFNPKSQKTVREQQEEENCQPVQRNVSRGLQGGVSSGIPGLETSHHPVKAAAPSTAEQEQLQRPGRRGRGGGESTFSLGWE